MTKVVPKKRAYKTSVRGKDTVNLSLRIHKRDHKFFIAFVEELNLSHSEFIRLFIQGLRISKEAEISIKAGKSAKFEIGGYGYEFSPQDLKSLLNHIETVFEAFPQPQTISHPKEPKACKRRYKHRIEGVKSKPKEGFYVAPSFKKQERELV